MKRKINITITISIAVLLFVLVAAVVMFEPWRTPVLTEERIAELKAAWETPDPLYADELSEELRLKMMILVIDSQLQMNPFDPGENEWMFAGSGQYRFIGNYAGYAAIFVKGHQMAYWEEHIGNEVFRAGNSSNIYLYRDGKRIALKKAYLEGLINDKQLYRLAARYYRLQVGEHGVIDERYRGVEQSKREKISDAQKEQLRFEWFYLRSNEFGYDIDSPGEGARIFADNDQSVDHYYLGTYNGVHAIFCDYGVSPSKTEIVGKELFTRLTLSYVSLWQGGNTIGLQKGFEKGWISSEDLFTLAKRFYQFQMENAEDPDAVRQLYGDYAARYESP